MKLFVPTAKGLEPLAAKELTALGAGEVAPTRAGVACTGSLEVAYRACLWLRTASRVLLPLHSFACADEQALYEGVRTVDWTEHLTSDRTLAVDFNVSAGVSMHTQFGAQRTKDAIVDQLRDRTGTRPSVDRHAPDVRINVHFDGKTATVSVDLSGESLHQRGYRAIAGEAARAPLKENLADAILLLADWERHAKDGVPLYDPMCGSGTIVIEAALMAIDRAPGFARERFGFSRWLGHDEATWQRVRAEADVRTAVRRKLPEIVGSDEDARAVDAARKQAAHLGIGHLVRFDVRPFSEATALSTAREETPRGLVVVNPPYGERLGDTQTLGPLYRELGDRLRREFNGWDAYVLSSDLSLVKQIGLKPRKRHVLWNGALECRLVELALSPNKVESTDGPAWRKPSAHAEMFKNRVAKNLRHLKKWAKREGVTCFRVYDADLPEYAVAVDLYERAVHVQEYEPPKEIETARAEAHLRDVIAVLPEVLEVDEKDIFVKVRRRQRGKSQYEKLGDGGDFRQIQEGAARLWINLGDYLDTGIFLDHRQARRMVAELCKGKRLLNLFSYTGTATVQAALAGAASSTSVDLSNTYCDWAARNFALNRLDEKRHRIERDDVMKYLARTSAHYDVIFVAPPTFSNSAKMDGTFDVQRDHVALISACSAHLASGGVIFFSTNLRRFKLDLDALAGFRCENITRKTLPPDFARDARFHTSFLITRGIENA